MPPGPDATTRLAATQAKGTTGSTYKLGRAVALRRRLPDAVYDREREQTGHKGPYMPLVLQACRESEYSYEYRHGVTSYGAFTYALTSVLLGRRRGEDLTFAALVGRVADMLAKLGYDQHPQLAGPKPLKQAKVPWVAPSRARRPQ